MNQEKDIDVYKAIADPTRRGIINLLARKNGQTINVIAGNFQTTRQGVTKHINYLRTAGLVKISRSGRNKTCDVDLRPLLEIHKWLSHFEKFWGKKLTDLESFLKNSK